MALLFVRSLESRAVNTPLPKPALEAARSRVAIVTVWFAVFVATSASAAASSFGHVAAASGDRAATLALLTAEYNLATAIFVRRDAAIVARARAAKSLGEECRGVLRGGPDESVLEEEGPSAPQPRLSGRAQGERARSELEKQTIEVEISETLSTAADRVLRGPVETYLGAVTGLAWSDPTINALVLQRIERLREGITGSTVPACADMRAWAVSGFHVLSLASKQREEARRAHDKPSVEGDLASLLRPYEGRAARKVLRRTAEVNERRRESARSDEVYAGAEYRMQRALGEKVSRFEQHLVAPVIAKGRTSAGSRFVIRANTGKENSRSCKREVDVDVEEGNGGSGGGVCLSESTHSQPSGMCSGSIETVELATSPVVHAARFNLGDGRTVTVSVVQIPRKFGGPAGVLIAAFRGYDRYPVSLEELSTGGKVIRTVNLKGIRCTKQSADEGPGPPQFVTLTTTTTPTGEPLSIQASLVHFRGQTEFSLERAAGTHDSEVSEEREVGRTAKPFQWNLSTECEPHQYTVLEGIITPPGAVVLARTPSGLVALTKVELAASDHAPGPLLYGVYTASPTEIVVERSDGTILYTESLAAKATEETEYCEGYAER